MIVLEFDVEYAHAFTNLAGRPYDTRQEALNRKKQLEHESNCTAPS